ncbi:MAG: helix-turn-helix transcriptional regulator [Candidatus Nomurabacteria bacterium]|nr:helix-turn-helix transcriptional regulator [Candidatus Nomurabacteria bacterium]
MRYVTRAVLGKSNRSKNGSCYTKARLESGLTQVQVAKKLKRPQSHISNVESGQQRVDVVELQTFAKIYNKDINYFIK